MRFTIITEHIPVAQIRETGEASAENGFEGLAILARQGKVEFKVLLDLLMMMMIRFATAKHRHKKRTSSVIDFSVFC